MPSILIAAVVVVFGVSVPYVDVLGAFFAFLGAFEVSPFQRYEFQAHMVAVGNRVLLGRGCYAFFPHVDLGFFVATSSKSSVFIGSSIHCAHGDVLLAFALFLH